MGGGCPGTIVRREIHYLEGQWYRSLAAAEEPEGEGHKKRPRVLASFDAQWAPSLGSGLQIPGSFWAAFFDTRNSCGVGF